MMSKAKNINLNIEIDVLTANSIADVVNGILEFLLYQRNQIPFVYKTYKYYVELWSENGVEAENTGLSNFQLQRQREQARSTKQAISAMREIISKSFEKNAIKSLRFLFGSTTFTPKEAYTINIPTKAISRDHYHVHHRLSHSRLNQTLMPLLTNADLYTLFSNNLCPTNLYLELEMNEDSISLANIDTKAQVFAKDIGKLPPSCKDIQIHLMHMCPPNVDTKALLCCKELQVFEDIMRLSISGEQQEETTALKQNASSKFTATWWEAEVMVRGFKEKPVRGMSMWSN